MIPLFPLIISGSIVIISCLLVSLASYPPIVIFFSWTTWLVFWLVYLFVQMLILGAIYDLYKPHLSFRRLKNIMSYYEKREEEQTEETTSHATKTSQTKKMKAFASTTPGVLDETLTSKNEIRKIFLYYVLSHTLLYVFVLAIPVLLAYHSTYDSTPISQEIVQQYMFVYVISVFPFAFVFSKLIWQSVY